VGGGWQVYAKPTSRQIERYAWLDMTFLVAFATSVLALFPAKLPLPEHGAARFATARPCNVEEWHIAQSDYAKELTRSSLEGLGGFSSCEVASSSLLPNSRILRLHTPVHVDWSYTATLLQANHNTKLKLVSSGRGMVARPRPDDPQAIAALNLLLAESSLSTNEQTIRVLADLYFFILDDEKRDTFFGPTYTMEQPLSVHAHDAMVRLGSGMATVTFLDLPWEFTFLRQDSRIHLASVKDRTTK
jgi:hypothetical protein